MNGREIYNVLKNKNVHFLHHANTITTSCTFLQQKGLVSRYYCETRNLPQTPQYSDEGDKRYGIWNDIFTDGVDIHKRAKFANHYGPVLFVLPIEILLSLPVETEIMVMKKNPVKWKSGESKRERYFSEISELQINYSYGDFGKHIIFRSPSGILPFKKTSAFIILDNPKIELNNGTDAFLFAKKKLKAAAKLANIDIDIKERQCQEGCKCLSSYSSLDSNTLFSKFGC